VIAAETSHLVGIDNQRMHRRIERPLRQRVILTTGYAARGDLDDPKRKSNLWNFILHDAGRPWFSRRPNQTQMELI
jgi:hypothetical protein